MAVSRVLISKQSYAVNTTIKNVIQLCRATGCPALSSLDPRLSVPPFRVVWRFVRIANNEKVHIYQHIVMCGVDFVKSLSKNQA